MPTSKPHNAAGQLPALNLFQPGPAAPARFIPGVPDFRRAVEPPPLLASRSAAIPLATSAKASAEPGDPPALLFERGLTAAAMGYHEAALEMLSEATASAPDHAPAWLKLAEIFYMAGRDDESIAARERAAAANEATGAKWKNARDKRSLAKIEAAERKLLLLLEGAAAEQSMQALRDHLFGNPLEVAAMRLLAQLEWQADDGVTAQCLLERAVALAPQFTAARIDFAGLLLERRSYVRSLAESAVLIAQAPSNVHYRAMRADTLVQLGRYTEAIALLEGLIKEHPRLLKFWLPYAHALHNVGRREDSVRAFRTCLDIAPATGEAYWGLADLKANHLTTEDVAAMRGLLEQGGLEATTRQNIYYALGHFLERARDFAGSFAAYEAGALAFRESVAGTRKAYDAAFATGRVRRLKTVFSAENFATRLQVVENIPAGTTPIFIVGMPRAGSTLVEQILASHSLVEGTRELPVMGDITRKLTLSRALVMQFAYPDCVLDLTQEQLTALGTRYVTHAREYCRSNRPYIVDKRPWNWLDAGLIHLILPNAKIIDIRRKPMAACFAMFKQMLPPDAAFSYDLTELGRYYNQYVSMMDHYNKVLPGRIHYVEYESLVQDTETEIRRMLDYCSLPFEESCLRFWETDRAVATPSAEQVRRPIFKDALEHWRNFEPWLAPLKAALSEAHQE